MYVTDSSGNVVKTTDLGALDAGAQTYQWNGQNTSGTTVSDGTYNVAVYATSTSGTSSLISTTVSGKVTGTQNSSGTFQLTLDNGMTVNFSDVKSVVDSTDSSSS